MCKSQNNYSILYTELINLKTLEISISPTISTTILGKIIHFIFLLCIQYTTNPINIKIKHNIYLIFYNYYYFCIKLI